jgi:hypothetical protein
MENKTSAECEVRNAELLEILKEFCSAEESRPTLHTPFSRGECSYSTDGRIIIRVPRLDSVPERSGAPLAEKLWSKARIDILKLKGWVEMPELPELQFNLCDDCFGSGMCEACPECEIIGSKSVDGVCVECENKNFHNCEQFRCEACNGSGKHPVAKRVTLGNTDLNLIYLRKINRLKGLLFSPTMPSPNDPVPFKFDGGDGLLMPMRKEVS